MSKRFTFRLDSLHRLRQHKTEQAKLALGEIARMRFEKEQEIERQKLYLQEYNEQTRSRKVADHQIRTEHIQAVRADIKRLLSELENLLEIEALRRKVLSEMMKEEKVLDSLREKKVAEHKSILLHEEQNLMDEIASRRDHADRD
ncbi:MAG: flagellar export protein FliJ [Candidatus Kapaibacterium sp.]|jgi:flagellar export protein FliJ